jgi:hypothetical protein
MRQVILGMVWSVVMLGKPPLGDCSSWEKVHLAESSDTAAANSVRPWERFVRGRLLKVTSRTKVLCHLKVCGLRGQRSRQMSDACKDLYRC